MSMVVMEPLLLIDAVTMGLGSNTIAFRTNTRQKDCWFPSVIDINARYAEGETQMALSVSMYSPK